MAAPKIHPPAFCAQPGRARLAIYTSVSTVHNGPGLPQCRLASLRNTASFAAGNSQAATLTKGFRAPRNHGPELDRLMVRCPPKDAWFLHLEGKRGADSCRNGSSVDQNRDRHVVKGEAQIDCHRPLGMRLPPLLPSRGEFSRIGVRFGSLAKIARTRGSVIQVHASSMTSMAVTEMRRGGAAARTRQQRNPM